MSAYRPWAPPVGEVTEPLVRELALEHLGTAARHRALLEHADDCRAAVAEAASLDEQTELLDEALAAVAAAQNITMPEEG